MDRPKQSRWRVLVFSALGLLPALARGQNLVPNGDFEAGAAGWTGGTVEVALPRPGHCLRVVDASAVGAVAATTALLPLDTSRRYLFGGWVRGGRPAQPVTFTLAQFDKLGRHIPNANWDFALTVGTDWTPLRGIVEGFHPSAVSVQVMLWPVPWTLDGTNQGVAWFDDIRLVPYSGNLVPNGGFEAAGGWTGGTIVPGLGRRGSRALQVDDPGAGDVNASSAARIPVLPGEPYLIEAWVRGERAGQQALVTLEQFDASGGQIPGRNIDLTVTCGASWTRLASRIVPHPDADAVRLVLRPAPWTADAGLSGRAWFDDVRLLYYGGNLLENGGFEAGASGWTGGRLDSVNPHGGTTAISIQDLSTSANAAAASVALIPTAPGTEYTFEAWVRTPLDGQEVWLAVNQFDANGNGIPYNNLDFIVKGRKEWTLFRGLLHELHPAAVGVRVTLYPVRWTEAGERQGSAWFDDVAIRLHQGNLVPNGGFDRGADGWEGGVPDATVAHGGRFSLLVEDWDSSSNHAASSGLLPITPGNPYTLSAWLRADEDRPVLLSLNQLDSRGKWIPGANFDFAVPAGTNWSCFQRVIQAFHPSAAFVRIVLYPTLWTAGGEGIGQAWFDDVRFGPEKQVLSGAWLRPGTSMGAWWSPPEQKVRRNYELGLGAGTAAAVLVAAARGEPEPFQVVLVPRAGDRLLGVRAGAFQGTGGAIVPAAAVAVREVAYVRIDVPTDPDGFVCCEMPDPLPELRLPLGLTAGEQQPLWVTVTPPAGATAGTYHGLLTLDFERSEDLTIAVDLRVWDFALPTQHHIQTAYGLSLAEIDRYHNLSRNHADPAAARDARREVLRRYLDDFAAHRVSAQDPFGDDLFEVRFPSWNWTDADLVPDPEHPGTNTVGQVRDDDPANCVAIGGSERLPVDRTRGYRLQWRARTDGAQDYLVSVNQYRADGQWISGANLDFPTKGNGSWQAESRDIPAARFNAQTASVRVNLYPRSWPACAAATGTAWFDDLDLRAVGDLTNLVPNPGFNLLRAQDVLVSIDFSRFDAAATYALNTRGADSFRLPLPFFPSGSATTGTYTPPGILVFPWGTPEYQVVFGRILRAIDDHLASRGWLGRAYAYWWDEPQPHQLDLVRAGMDVLDAADPRLRRLLTFYLPIHQQVEGRVDVFTPQIDQYLPDWAASQRQKGNETWWYVCSGNRAPWPNNFIDYSALDVRLQPWMAWRFGAQGSLYWQTNYWAPDPGCVTCPDPWVDAQSSVDGGFFGNGDGRLLYPPREFADGVERRQGPVPSLRWELLRDGLEDYEYFWMLDDASRRLQSRDGNTPLVQRARALLQIPDAVVRSLSARTARPDPMATHRQAVGQALEEVTQALRRN